MAQLEHWRVYSRARHASAAAAPAAARGTAGAIGAGGLRAPGAQARAGFLVRVRATPFWKLSGAPGCVGKSGRWTVVRADQPGPVRVSIGFSLKRAGRSATGWHENCLSG